MSNLFNTITRLEEFTQKPTIPENQKQFILSILNGNGTIARLEDIVRYRKKEDLAALHQNVKKMLQDTSYFSTNGFSFIRLLKGLSSDIEGMQQSEERLADIVFKNPKRYLKYRDIFDSLYQTTEQKYKGTLMMPIMQAMEARLGDSQGECFGYIAEWASQLHQNKKFMGVPANVTTPPFKRVQVNSESWTKYPDLNHLALLTPKISAYQKIQANTTGLVKQLSEAFSTTDQGIAYNEGKYQFYPSLERIAEELVQTADTKPDLIYNLNVLGYIGGHALGFCKLNNQYHFMDSNSGWFRFNNAEDFQKWLPYYFKKLKYDKHFGEYAINAYALTPADQAKKKEEPEIKLNIVAKVLIYTFIIPIAAVYILYKAIDLFVIRGFKYAFIKLKDAFKKEAPFEDVLEDDLPPAPTPEPIPSKLDYLDLAVQPEKKATSSVSRIAGMLDIPLKDLAKVQERADNNKEFKQSKPQTLFQKPAEPDFSSPVVSATAAQI